MACKLQLPGLPDNGWRVNVCMKCDWTELNIAHASCALVTLLELSVPVSYNSFAHRRKRCLAASILRQIDSHNSRANSSRMLTLVRREELRGLNQLCATDILALTLLHCLIVQRHTQDCAVDGCRKIINDAVQLWNPSYHGADFPGVVVGMYRAPILFLAQQLRLVRVLQARRVKRGDCTKPDDEQARHHVGVRVVRALHDTLMKVLQSSLATCCEQSEPVDTQSLTFRLDFPPSAALISGCSGSNSQLSSPELQGVTFEWVVMKVLLGVERFAALMSCIVLFFISVRQRTPAASNGFQRLDDLVKPHTRYGGGIGVLCAQRTASRDDGVLELVVHG